MDIKEMTQEQLLAHNSDLSAKLEASKIVLTELNEKLESGNADAESVKADLVAANAEKDKLESEVAELTKQLEEKAEAEKKKSEGEEEMKKCEELQAEIDRLKAELEEAKSMKGEADEAIARASGLLADMAAIGTKEEILAKVEAHDSAVATAEELTAKVESYEAIGSVDQLTEAMGEYKEMKLESAATELANELSISADKVKLAIDKFESVDEAKEFLIAFGAGSAKSESAEEVADEKLKGESEEGAEAPAGTMKAESQMDELKRIMKKL